MATDITDRSPGEDLLVVKAAKFAYLDRFTALDDVSLTICRGEKVALLGANGCGKSTLLKVLDGLVFPNSGTYTAFGSSVTETNLEDEQFSQGFRSRIGFIFQNSDAQVFSPTVREEVAFGPLNMGMSPEQVRNRVDDTLAMLDIIELAARAPYQLSGGQKKRVAIASVLVMNPEVLLFDEPTAALDPRTQQWLMELIVELNTTGKTIVLATHDLDTLDTIADRCFVFSEAHTIVADGPPDEILADRELLLSVNLIHEHTRVHLIPGPQPGKVATVTHSHDHGPGDHNDVDHLHRSDDAPVVETRYAEVLWSVPTTCEACERTIERTVRPLIGIDSVRVDVSAQLVTIRYRPQRANLPALRDALAKAGYPTTEPATAPT